MIIDSLVTGQVCSTRRYRPISNGAGAVVLKSIFEEVVVAQPLHWNMHRPIPPLPDTDRRSPQLYVPPRNRQHQRHLAERSRKTSLLRHVCAVSTVAAQAGSALALLAVVRTIVPDARAAAVTSSAIFIVRSPQAGGLLNV